MSVILAIMLSAFSVTYFVPKSENKQTTDIEVSGANETYVGFYAIRRDKIVDLYVTIQNVNDLYGFDINVTWNPIELEYISHSVRIPVETFSDGILHEVLGYPVLIVKNIVNASLGRYWIAASSTGAPWATPPEGAPPFNGCGNVVIITFTLKTEQCYNVDFDGIDLADAPDGPSDPSDPIPYAIQKGIEITSPPNVQLNPPIFNVNYQLWMRIAKLGSIRIRSIGYAGWIKIQTGPIARGISLFVEKPGTLVKEDDLLPCESINIPLYLGLSPGVYSGQYDGTIFVSWGEKTKEMKVTLNIVSLKVCGNLVITGPGGWARFVWLLTGGSKAYLEVEELLPSGWSYILDPPAGVIFDTPYTVSLNITASEDAAEGDRGIIILRAFDEAGVLFWHFTYAAVVDSTPPAVYVERPRYLNYSEVHERILAIETNVSDLTAGVETVKVFYSIDGGPWVNETMDWVVGDTFNSTKYSVFVPLSTNKKIKYYIVATDNVGHETITQNYTYIPGDTDWLEPFDVDILDVVIITAHYGSKIGQPNWDERADVDGNGKIEIFDVVIATSNYGKKDP